MTRQRLVLILIATIMLASPVAAQNREHQQMAADARMLQEQIQQLTILMTAANQALSESIKALNARLEAANDATRKGFADQKVQIDNLGNDVRVIRERTDETSVRIGTLSEELEALRATVQSLQQMTLTAAPPVAPLDPNAPPTDTPPVQQPAPAAVPSTAGLSPTQMFRTAETDYFQGQYTSAITGFQALIMAFPGSELADDAYLNIGESYYAQNRWADAIAAYNQVIQNYPGKNAVPQAYYKRGLAQERSGQVDAARASWEAVIKSSPESDAARLAKQGLDRVNRAQQQ